MIPKSPKSVSLIDRKSQCTEYILLDNAEKTPCAHSYMLLKSYPDIQWKRMYKDRY